MLSKPTPPRTDLSDLIKKSIEAVEQMSPEERRQMRRAQAISFVYGNISLENESVTRELVERLLSETYGPTTSS